jgi:hypothetical protein
MPRIVDSDQIASGLIAATRAISARRKVFALTQKRHTPLSGDERLVDSKLLIALRSGWRAHVNRHHTLLAFRPFIFAGGNYQAIPNRFRECLIDTGVDLRFRHAGVGVGKFMVLLRWSL